MSHEVSPISSLNCELIEVHFEFNSERGSDTSELSHVAQKAIHQQLNESVKPGLPTGRVIPLQLGDSNEGLAESSPSIEDHDSGDQYYQARSSSDDSIIGLKGADDGVVVQETEVSASPDTAISISPKPGIVAKAFSRIFKKSNAQIVQSTVQEINKKYKQFTKELKPGQSFEDVKKSLNNKTFISQIMELKALSGSFKSDTNQKVEDGLKLFKQMMKALEFIDVATQQNPSIKLNMTQIQVVKTILKGAADPLYQTPESRALGTGTYGTVAETSPGLPEKEGLASYAIKCCKSQDVSAVKELQTEYEVLMKFDHPNIIQPIYVHDRVLYMELAQGGPLHKKYHTMEVAQLIETLTQTADALAYMHEKGYVHGDVKVDNIFLTEELDAKVGDLGLCRELNNFNFDFVGAYRAYYYPPECLSGAINLMDKKAKKEAALKIDSWSFGAMLWWMLNVSTTTSLYTTDHKPLPSEELMETIRHSPKSWELRESGCEIVSIMLACLNADFASRPTMSEVRDMLKRGCV